MAIARIATNPMLLAYKLLIYLWFACAFASLALCYVFANKKRLSDAFGFAFVGLVALGLGFFGALQL